MASLFVIFLHGCKLAFLASSTCVKIIEFALRNETRKAYLHVHKRITIMPAIYERGLLYHSIRQARHSLAFSRVTSMRTHFARSTYVRVQYACVASV